MMEIGEIVSRLEGATGKLERAALEAADGQREEIVPELLRILNDAVVNASERAQQDAYLGHLYAALLLAQFREIRAYPALIRLAEVPPDILDDLCQDFMTEGFSQCVASVCDGDLKGIESVIENPAALEWARSAMLHSLVVLVANGRKSREEILGYFASLYRGRLDRTWSHAWDKLAAVSADLCAVELIDDIEQAYDEELIDPGFIGLDDVQRHIAMGPERAMARLQSDSHCSLVDSAIEEMEWWACFDDDGSEERKPSPPANPPFASSVPVLPKVPKTGRNDTCPCGSGKKYKKCCGA